MASDRNDPHPARATARAESSATRATSTSRTVHAGAPPPCTRAYGLVGLAVSPPDVLRGRGRIFPVPARGTRTPVGSPVRAPRWSSAEVFSWHQRGEGERPRRCRPSARSTRAGVRSRAHRFVAAGRTGCTGSRRVAVIVEHQGDDASKRRAVQQRRTATHPTRGGSGQLRAPRLRSASRAPAGRCRQFATRRSGVRAPLAPQVRDQMRS